MIPLPGTFVACATSIALDRAYVSMTTIGDSRSG